MQPNVSNVNLFVCEKILTEGDIFSAIRIADLFVTTINSDIPIGSQAVQMSIFGQIKMTDTDQTEHTLELQLIRPDGEVQVVGPLITGPPRTKFSGIPGGYNIAGEMAVVPRQLGQHFFSLLLDGVEIARCPFTLLDHAPDPA